MILLTPKNCKEAIVINPEEVSSFELRKGLIFNCEENPKEAIFISTTMKDGKKYTASYGFDNKQSRDKCFSELKEKDGHRLPKSSAWGIFEEIISILNATQRKEHHKTTT